MNKYHLFKLGYLRLTFQSQVICEYALHIQIYSLRFPFPGVFLIQENAATKTLVSAQNKSKRVLSVHIKA